MLIALLGLSVAAAGGCASFLSQSGQQDGFDGKVPEAAEPSPMANAAPLVPKEGLTGEKPPGTLQAPTAPADAVQQIQGLDPAIQAQLVENLKQTPPEMWPQILQSFRTAAAAKPSRREPPPNGQQLPMPARTLDGSAPPPTVMNGSGLAQHAYDPREPRPAPAQSPAAVPANALAAAFPSARDSHNGLSALNDSLDDPAVQPVSYEAASSSVDNSREALETAIRELEQPSAGNAGSSDSAKRQIELRLLYLAAGRRDDALRPIPGMTTAEQEFWASQLYALSTWLDTDRIPAADRRASETLVQLDRARAKLAEIGTLQIRNPQLCTRVDGYGAFTKFKEDAFRPKQDVVLYVELENFKSESTDAGFRTALSSRYRILDAQGRQVVEQTFPEVEEVCQNRRRDYYISFRVQMPERIYDGRHTLQLTIEDTLGKKVGQTSIEFSIKE